MLDRILAGVDNNRNILLTGGAGVGKTWHTNKIIEHLTNKKRTFAVTAMTGLASQHLDLGETIHTFLGSGVMTNPGHANVYHHNSQDAVTDRIRAAEYVFIDEISMARPDFFEMKNKIFQRVMNNNLPFGGKGIALIGDFFQLAPVISKQESLEHRWCFQTDAFKNGKFAIVNLTEVKRQNDEDFIRVLNKVRCGIVDKEVFDFFSKCKGEFSARPTYLMARVKMVDEMNAKCLNELEGKTYSVDAIISLHEEVKKYASESEIKSLYIKVMAESGLPRTHHLKIGCRLMLLANNKDMMTSNGSTGTLVDFVTIDKSRDIWTSPEGKDYDIDWQYHGECLLVKLDDGRHVLVPRKRSVHQQFKYHNENTGGDINDITYSQYPVTLGYAITIHKSQGMSLDNVSVDPDGIFGFGQFYVAVSRAKTKTGLFVKNFKRDYVKADPMVLHFYNNLLDYSGGKK